MNAKRRYTFVGQFVTKRNAAFAVGEIHRKESDLYLRFVQRKANRRRRCTAYPAKRIEKAAALGGRFSSDFEHLEIAVIQNRSMIAIGIT